MSDISPWGGRTSGKDSLIFEEIASGGESHVTSRSKATRGRIEIREMVAGRASGRDEHGGEVKWRSLPRGFR
jgi:hypothetical protein